MRAIQKTKSNETEALYPRVHRSKLGTYGKFRGSDEPSALASGLVGGMSYVFFVSPDEIDGGLTPPGDV